MPLTSQVLEALGDPVIALDHVGEVIVWTPAAERLLGYAAAEVRGRPLPDLGIRLDTLLAGRERRVTLRTREGGVFPATVTATRLLSTEGQVAGVVLLVKDLTPWIGPAGEDVASTEELIVEERLGAAFREIVEVTGTEFDRGGRLDPLAHGLAEQGRRLLPGISCLIAIVPSARHDVLLCVGGAGPLTEGMVGEAAARGDTSLGAVLAGRQAVEHGDGLVDEGASDPFRPAGPHTVRVVPMTTQETLPDGRTSLGVIAFYRTERRAFTESERRLMDAFGALVSLSLHRAELRVTAERTMARLELAVKVALDLARSLDVSEVVRRLVRRAAVATEADRCTLLRLEGGEDGEVVTEDSYDVSGYEGGIGYRQPIGSQVLLREAVTSRAPVLGDAYYPTPMPARLRKALGDVKRTATVPLVYGGEVIAVLVLSRRRDLAFSSEEIDTLLLLAGPAALALRNSFLYARTEEASRVKTDFLDMAAHELRTPLTVIGGYLSILREGAFGPTPPDWQKPLRILDAKAADLRRLVDDLLLAARVETGRLEAVMLPVDLREVVEQSVQAVDDVPETRLPEDPVMVLGDREHLGRLLDHLVMNALGYGREGEAPWASIVVEAEPERGEARLTVEDRGRGLAAGAEERIFERFSRIEDPEHPMVPGTGLGLYIARELALLHGGRLELEWSRPSAGSRFALYLPLLEGPTHPED